MSLRVLIVGMDGRGSFQVRGQQLGGAIGARVTTRPTPADWRWAEVIVLVKRAVTHWGAEAKATGCPLIWDVLDFWRQPDENGTPIVTLRAEILRVRDRLGVRTLIGATRAMAESIGGVYLPHHSRPGLTPAPPRLEVGQTLVVGYEGQSKYLGPWRAALEAACAELGMRFVLNPPDLRDLDVVVALRGGRWDGEVCRQWKSGVKYVNAIVAGRPVLTQTCAAWFEQSSAAGMVIGDLGAIGGALSVLSEPDVRALAYARAVDLAQSHTLEAIAASYRQILQETARVAA